MTEKMIENRVKKLQAIEAQQKELEASSNVYIGGGKRCRGYVGIQALAKPTVL